MELRVQKIHELAKMPNFAHDTDAGMDLCTVVDITIEPGERVQIPTGLALAIPEGYVGLVWDKSGISQKAGLKTFGGVIDAGYRGEIFVGLLNTSDTAHTFAIGAKLAQILIQKIEHPTLLEVASLDATPRGDGAFGSTGV
jgi:dUTP pyrophosphatase